MKRITAAICFVAIFGCAFLVSWSFGQEVKIPWQQGRPVSLLVKSRNQINGEPTIVLGTLKLTSKVPEAAFISTKYVLVDGKTVIGLETSDFVRNILDKKVAVLGTFVWVPAFDKDEQSPFCYITGDKVKDVTAIDKEEDEGVEAEE